MNITILTVGSQGDILPYLALGLGLRAAGYTVTLATSPRFASLISERGLRYAPIHADVMQLLDTPEGKAALAGKGRLKLLRETRVIQRQILDDGWAAAQGANAIVYHPKAIAGYHVAEKLGVPGFLALPFPLFAPTRAFPSPVLPVRNLGGSLNRLTHQLISKALFATLRNVVNPWRREVLGLPPAGDELVRDGRPVSQLYAYSHHVLPRPADWNTSTLVTGYWFLDRADDWRPSAALETFLAAGPAPIYIGFGSMVGEDAARTTTMIMMALEQTGQRVVLATGVGGLLPKTVPANVCVIEGAPHDWLFPRMAAIVHHGGAGTTAAALRAGRPMLICPFFGDQPFWGRRIAELGAGPQPIPYKRLTVGNLAAALQCLTADETMQHQAEALGQHIRAEDGVARAVAAIAVQLGQPTNASVNDNDQYALAQ